MFKKIIIPLVFVFVAGAVKSHISGIARRAHVEVGELVKAGDSLFETVPDLKPLE